MSIAIKNNNANEVWVRDQYELISQGLLAAGSPWGRGFAVGISMALVILLPIFFAYALINGPMSHRGASVSEAPQTRDFSSASADAGYKNYLEK